MAKVPNGVERLLKISIAWVGCTNVTDDRRQTDDRQTDGRHIANMNISSRSLKTLDTKSSLSHTARSRRPSVKYYTFGHWHFADYSHIFTGSENVNFCLDFWPKFVFDLLSVWCCIETEQDILNLKRILAMMIITAKTSLWWGLRAIVTDPCNCHKPLTKFGAVRSASFRATLGRYMIHTNRENPFTVKSKTGRFDSAKILYKVWSRYSRYATNVRGQRGKRSTSRRNVYH